jgi:hypothetical protein
VAASDRILAVVVEAVAKLKKRLDAVESASPVAGIDGRDGVDGATGPAGPTGPQGEQGPAGPKGDTGETGLTGPAGQQGETGQAGRDGNNGVSVTAATVEGDELFIALDSGDVLRAGNVRGIRGPKGDAGEQGIPGVVGASGRDGVNGTDGRGIEAADLDTDGHLILKFTDGEEIDVGRVVGRDGKDGITQTLVRAAGQKQQTQSNQISDGRFFEIDVSGLSFSVDVSELGLSRVRNFNVRNHDGFDVSVVSRMSGSIFELSSNVALDGHKLFLE